MGSKAYFRVLIQITLVFIFACGALWGQDHEPPCINWEYPFMGAYNVPIDSTLSLSICGFCREEEATWVDPSTINLWLTPTGDTTFSLDLVFDYEPVWCMGYSITFILNRTSGIPVGEEVEICVSAMDSAGNLGMDCIFFTIADTGGPVDTVDTEPPCFSESYPHSGAANIPVNTDANINICGICGSTPPTMVDSSSILIEHFLITDTVLSLGLLSRTLEPNRCMGYFVFFGFGESPLPYNSNIMICIQARDMASNLGEYCFSFTTEDSGGIAGHPCVEWLYPSEGDTVLPDISLHVDICGLCGEDSLYSSWIDSASILLTYYYIAEHEALVFTEIECMGYAVEYDFSGCTLMPGEVNICINAMNMDMVRIVDCITFFVNDTSSGDDTIPPCATWRIPADDSTVSPTTDLVIDICGVCGPAGPSTMVDSSSIILSLEYDSVFTEITGYSLVPIYCMGYSVYHNFSRHPLPWDTDITICIQVADLAGNWLEECLDFHTASESHPDSLVTIMLHTVDAMTHEALPGILVYACHFYTGSLSAAALSGLDGITSLEVPAGPYLLGANDPDGRYYQEFYFEAHDPAMANVVEIIPGSVIDITFTLETITALYGISGSIIDEALNPVPGAFAIVVSSEEDEDWTNTALADSMGNYQLFTPPGEYYVIAFSPGYIPIIYDAEFSWESATPVIVDTARVSGINFIISTLDYLTGDSLRSFIRGVVYGDDDPPRKSTYPYILTGARVYIKNIMNPLVCYATTFTDGAGEFHFSEIPLGSYLLAIDKVFYEPYEREIELTETGWEDNNIILINTTGIQDDNILAPGKLTLFPNYPNPYNASTALTFILPHDGEVSLKVYDLLGNVITTLLEGRCTKGFYSVKWQPDELGSGLYFGRLSAGGETRAIRILYIK
ncbi:T9SS type A sorting domain-containing protein [bacterium]|nr:T9SS type A sorting domain-containing protein [bacterium]